MIFRRTYPEVTNEGGLWDTSEQIYPYVGARPNRTSLQWRFPSGASVKFGHLDNEDSKLAWMGSQIPLIAFDELTLHSSSVFWFMLSRNRSTCGVKPYVRASCNPDADSWVAELIDWWIDPHTGYPIPERAGQVRWFLRLGDRMEWGDTREELRARFPGPEFIPKSLTFIPSSVYDNRVLMQADPGYLANLMALPTVDRERLLRGNWKIKPAAGLIFNRGWYPIVPSAMVPEGGVLCRFWDFAATEKELGKGKRGNRDPDFTASVLMRRVRDSYYIEDSISVQTGPAETDNLVHATAAKDRAIAESTGARLHVRFEQEGGASGKRDAHRMIRELAGYDVKGIAPQGDKLVRAKPFASQSMIGNVKLVFGDWNESWLVHMHNQPDWPHDDTMDATSSAFNDLTDPIERRRSAFAMALHVDGKHHMFLVDR